MQNTVGMAPLFRDKKSRAWELDFLRGIAVLAMCFDHAMYDFTYYKGWFSNSKDVHNAALDAISKFAAAFWKSGNALPSPGFRFWAHYIFVFVFLFLVGISCSFSRDNIKRGAVLGLFSAAFSAVTVVLDYLGIMELIIFGILQCITFSILFVAATDILTGFNKKVNVITPLVLGFVILAIGISREFWMMAYNWDDVLTPSHIPGYVLGTHAYGGDWFGLFPYIGAVFLGSYFGKAVYASRQSLLPKLDGKWNKPVCFVGRHAVWFFLAHQVVIAGVLGGVCLILGYRF